MKSACTFLKQLNILYLSTCAVYMLIVYNFVSYLSSEKSQLDEDTEDLAEEEDEDSDTFDEEFRLHKRNYYMTKLEYEDVDKQVLRDQCEEYVRAIQWILLYYFEGVPSWSW